MKLFKVHSSGAFTTVQDGGRLGYQKMGIPISGALDAFAYRVANLLVGNPVESAVLEITITGPKLEFIAESDIALTGAKMGMTLNEKPVGQWQSLRVLPGDILEVHQVTAGCRAYLSISGGIDVPVVMGSRSTYVGGKLGGFEGRPLQTDDVVCGFKTPLLEAPRVLPGHWIPEHQREISLRVIPGPQDDFFDAGLETLLTTDYMVTPKADRMGYRLQGAAIERIPGTPASIVSEPSMPGGIQIPADAQPIVLLVEQTVGGYSKIATVITPDIARLTQATPGDTVRFEKVDLAQAHKIYRDSEKKLQEIADSLG